MEMVEIEYGLNIDNLHKYYRLESSTYEMGSLCYYSDLYLVNNPTNKKPQATYLYEWVNPHPDKIITGIDFNIIKGETEGAIGLLAATALLNF